MGPFTVFLGLLSKLCRPNALFVPSFRRRRYTADADTRVIWPSCYWRWICVVSASYRQDSIPHSAVLAENSDSVGGPSQRFCIGIPSPVNFKRRAQRSVTCNHNIADVIILGGTFVKIIQSSNIQNNSIKQYSIYTQRILCKTLK